MAPIVARGTVEANGQVLFDGDPSAAIDLHSPGISKFAVDLHQQTGTCKQQTSVGRTLVCCVQSPDTPSLSFECSPVCFPGEALAEVQGRGRVAMNSIAIGDNVLVELDTGRLAYEPVLGYLHVMSSKRAEYLTVTHELGEFRASAGHLIFTSLEGDVRNNMAVGMLTAGHTLLVANSTSGSVVKSQVLSVRRNAGVGMYAPLTASGTIVVDSVVASIYASPSPSSRLPHGAAHAALFLVRAYHALGLTALRMATLAPPGDKSHTADEMHPFMSLLYRQLNLDLVLQAS